MFELTPIPNTDKLIVKDKFKEHFSKLTDFDEFMKYNFSFLRKSIRVNTLKTTVKEVSARLKGNWHLKEIPWCKEGFWIQNKEGRLDVGNTLEHTIGYYYVQESASMLPPIVLDPQPGEIVLDLCAAPGSKTSQIAQYMKNKGLLIANDVSGDRLAALGLNLQRMGIANAVITLGKGELFKDVLFDRILVDAPCSGTGTIRKSLKTLLMWNPNMTKSLQHIQKKLVTNAFSRLKSRGTIVYSTCSVEPAENEEVVDFLLKNHPDAKLQTIDLDIKKTKPITSFNEKEYDSSVDKCLRIWPQDNDTEGFFVAKIRKE